MKFFDADGESLWKTLLTSLSFSEEEIDIFDQKHSKTMLQDLLKQWLEKPEASWKGLCDILNKAPQPGPKIAETITMSHKELVAEEEQERISCGAQPLFQDKEQFTFHSIKQKETGLTSVLQSFDPLTKQLQGKMNEVRQRLQQSNEEFLSEVNKGASYWKTKRDEEYMINLGIAEKLNEVTSIVRELQGAFESIKKHYMNYLSLEKKLHSELIEAKKYFNETYFKHLKIRIARLEHLGSRKKGLLVSVYETLQTLSSIVLKAEENHTKCSELTLNDRKYMLHIKDELTAANGALNRIKSTFLEYKRLKEEELQKWDAVRAWATGIGIAGLALAPFTLGLTLLVSGGAVAAFVYTEVYTSDSRNAICEYRNKIDQCSSYSRTSEGILEYMKNELWITENKNMQCGRR